MNFYKRYMADYARKTSRLTLMQHGAYTLLLDELYATEQPLPSDVQELYRVCRAMTRDEQAAVRFVADSYFPIAEDGKRYNPRASQEIGDASASIDAAKANGTKGGRPKKETQKKPSGFFSENPVGFENETKTEPSGLPSGFKTEKLLRLSDYNNAIALSSESAIPTHPPDCPFDAILDAYAAELPMLPQPRRSLFRGSKDADALRQRWRWVLSAKHESGQRKGQPLATTTVEGIDWFRRFFGYVAQSDFLTGSSKKWQASLGWLVNKSNFEKVVNGNYVNQKIEETA